MTFPSGFGEIGRERLRILYAQARSPGLTKALFRIEITRQLPARQRVSGTAAFSLCLQTAALVFAEGFLPADCVLSQPCRKQLPRKQGLSSHRAPLLFILSSDESLLLVTY